MADPVDSRLWTHQKAAVERIIEDKGVHALLHEPGAGKTLTTIAYLERLRVESGHPIRAIVVVPKSALGVWPAQLAEHCIASHSCEVLSGPVKERLAALYDKWDTHDINVIVLPYSTFQGFRTKAAAKPVIDAVKAYAPDVMILDESHHVKSATSNTSKIFGHLSSLCPRRLILTGTPTPHSPADIYGQWRFLDPSAFAGPDGKMVSFTRWMEGYAKYGGFQGRQVVGWFDQDDLKERISRRSSVVKTADCHDLPPLIVQRHTFALSPAEQRAYDQMRKDMLTVIEDETITAQNKIVSILRLRQICAGYLPYDDGLVVNIGTTRRDLTVELASDLLATEKRLVILAWSRLEVDTVFHALKDAAPWGTGVSRITGDTPTWQREATLTEFASDSPHRHVLVAQVDTVSSGTNALVGASHMIYLSLSNNGGTWTQSLARLHRPGQTANKVVAHVIQAAGTIDCTMLDVLQGRAEEQSSLMEHIRGAR